MIRYRRVQRSRRPDEKSGNSIFQTAYGKYVPVGSLLVSLGALAIATLQMQLASQLRTDSYRQLHLTEQIKECVILSESETNFRNVESQFKLWQRRDIEMEKESGFNIRVAWTELEKASKEFLNVIARRKVMFPRDDQKNLDGIIFEIESVIVALSAMTGNRIYHSDIKAFDSFDASVFSKIALATSPLMKECRDLFDSLRMSE